MYWGGGREHRFLDKKVPFSKKVQFGTKTRISKWQPCLKKQTQWTTISNADLQSAAFYFRNYFGSHSHTLIFLAVGVLLQAARWLQRLSISGAVKQTGTSVIAACGFGWAFEWKSSSSTSLSVCQRGPFVFQPGPVCAWDRECVCVCVENDSPFWWIVSVSYCQWWRRMRGDKDRSQHTHTHTRTSQRAAKTRHGENATLSARCCNKQELVVCKRHFQDKVFIKGQIRFERCSILAKFKWCKNTSN